VGVPRGELVGDAYIRITADTTAMRRALKREAALAEAEGGSAGKGYTSAFGKEVEKRADQDLKGAREKIRKALVGALSSGDFSEFQKALGGVEPAATRLRMELNRLRETNQLNSREFEVFTNQVDKWARSALIEERAKADAEALSKLHDEALKLNTVWDKNAAAQKKAFADMQAEAIRMNRTYDVQANARLRADQQAWNAMVMEARKANTEFDRLNKERTRATAKAWADMVTEAKRMNAEFDRGQRASAAATKKAWNDMRVEANRMNKEFDRVDIATRFREASIEAEKLNATLRNSRTHLFGADRDLKSVEVSMKKIREGARGAEAFIKKTGSATRDMDRDTRRAGKGAEGLFSVFGGINKTLEGISHRGNPLVDLLVAPLRAGTALGSVFDKIFLKSFGGLAKGSPLLGGLVSLGAAAGAAVIAILAMIKTASLLASSLSLVAGAAVIAASAIGGALVGALLAAAAAVPAVLAGLGGMVLFIKDFNKNAPKSVQAFKDFGTAFQKAFDTEAFKGIDRKVGTLLNALRPMSQKLATDLGKTFAGIATGIVTAFTDPAIKKSLSTILSAIPTQVAALGSALTNLTTGLIGFFAPIMPFATDLLRTFNVLFESFSKWANSTKGQSSIGKFMQTTYNLAVQLASILGNVARAIGNIFTAATTGPAQDFFKFLDDVTRKFADFTGSAQGQNAMKEWFADVKTAAQGLGELILGIATVFDHLDTSKGREQIAGALDTVGRFLQQSGPAIDAALGFVDKLLDKLGTVDLKPFGDLLALVGNFAKDIADALKGNALEALDAKLEGFNELGATIRKDLIPALQDAMVWLKPLSEFIGGTVLKNLAASFKGVADIISGLTESLSGFVDIITGIVTLDVSKIGEGFRKEFEGSGKILAGAFNAGTGPIKGFIDQTIGGVSQGFSDMQTQASEFFGGATDDAQTWSDSSTEASEGFFDSFTKGFEDTRLAVGQWFDDMFSAPDIDFSGIGQSISDLGTTIGDAFTTARLAVGQFFTDMGESIGSFFTDTLPAKFEEMGAAIGDFFAELPNRLAYIGGAIVGTIVTQIMSAWMAATDALTTVIFPFFAELPGNIANAIIAGGNWIQGWFIAGYDAIINFFQTTFFPFFASVPGHIADAIVAAGNWIQGWFVAGYDNIVAFFQTTIIPFFTSIPGRLSDAIIAAGDWIQVWFQRGYDNIVNFFGSTIVPWFRSLPGVLQQAFMERVTGFRDWFAAMFTNLQGFWNNTIAPWIRTLPAVVLEAFSRLAINVGRAVGDHMKGVINGLITQINNFIRGFNDFSPFDIPTLRYLASGGLVDHPTMAMVGEAGREAVVPLDRPLSQVDESVRWLAAIAQGKTSYASGGVVGGKSLNIAPGAISVTVPNSDPVQVASAVVDRMAAGVFV
jgi:hypothetical protein